MIGFSKLVPFRVLNKAFQTIKVPNRASHGRNFIREPNLFVLRKLFDMIHFYVCIGLGTSIPVIMWFNLTQAPAELADIPEGYEPEPWEYEKHPIRRFLGKHLFPDPRNIYEQHLTDDYMQKEKYFVLQHARRIENVMSRKKDSASWFYEPIDRTVARTIVSEKRQLDEDSTRQVEYYSIRGHHLQGPDPPPDYLKTPMD